MVNTGLRGHAVAQTFAIARPGAAFVGTVIQDCMRRDVPGKVVVGQDAEGGTVRIVELATAQRPYKRQKAGQAEQQRQRDEKNQDVHVASSDVTRVGEAAAPSARAGRKSRIALSVTNTDEPDIASAAISGVTRPATAIGTAKIL